jgi:uncharacterized phage protein (TIGR01671 family)
MNREIKFRGKTAKGEWLYGYYLEKELCDGAGKCAYIKFDGSQEVRVSKETVGQFTGLCDGNGKEIYEGDILSLVASNGVKINVTCRFGSAHRTMKDTNALCDIVGFYFEHANGAKSFPMVCNYKGLHDTEIMEIIGNIHDNPNLSTTK